MSEQAPGSSTKTVAQRVAEAREDEGCLTEKMVVARLFNALATDEHEADENLVLIAQRTLVFVEDEWHYALALAALSVAAYRGERPTLAAVLGRARISNGPAVERLCKLGDELRLRVVASPETFRPR